MTTQRRPPDPNSERASRGENYVILKAHCRRCVWSWNRRNSEYTDEDDRNLGCDRIAGTVHHYGYCQQRVRQEKIVSLDLQNPWLRVKTQ